MVEDAISVAIHCLHRLSCLVQPYPLQPKRELDLDRRLLVFLSSMVIPASTPSLQPNPNSNLNLHPPPNPRPPPEDMPTRRTWRLVMWGRPSTCHSGFHGSAVQHHAGFHGSAVQHHAGFHGSADQWHYVQWGSLSTRHSTCTRVPVPVPMLVPVLVSVFVPVPIPQPLPVPLPVRYAIVS